MDLAKTVCILPLSDNYRAFPLPSVHSAVPCRGRVIISPLNFYGQKVFRCVVSSIYCAVKGTRIITRKEEGISVSSTICSQVAT